MLRRSLESLIAGCVVYGALAACSGSGTASAPGREVVVASTDGGQPSSGGAQAQAAGSVAAAGSPVPDAMAASGSGGGVAVGGGAAACPCEPSQPKEPTVVEATCATVDGLPSAWATASFPGLTVIELSRVTAVLDYSDETAGVYKWPASFTAYASPVYVKDGAVATNCGLLSAPKLQATRARFVLP